MNIRALNWSIELGIITIDSNTLTNMLALKQVRGKICKSYCFSALARLEMSNAASQRYTVMAMMFGIDNSDSMSSIDIIYSKLNASIYN